MAQREQYNRNPLDLKRNKAIGVMLPLGGAPLFKLSYTTEEQGISNLKNLILTRKGERPFQPEFGTEVYSLLFENISPSVSDDLESSLRSDIKYWLPYVIVDSIDVTTDEDRHRINIVLQVRITENGANTNITILVSEQGNVSIV
jgi:phage baseplate assembly protein W|tara:strand:+ start:14977 stop:15411 length:435 start_codon:yes stop_codon:yes gene_type:complete